jgi:uncharacterized protein (TIGR02611 family)
MRAWVFRRPGGRVAWRVAVGIGGLVVVIFGIVLLVIPGPGWVVIFLGMSIWATGSAGPDLCLRSLDGRSGSGLTGSDASPVGWA